MTHIRSVGIVGGGVSGLAAAVLLARKGVAVTVYEAGPKLGGSCGTTEIDGYVFSDGAVYVALPEIIDIAFDRLGLDRRAVLPLRPITAVQTTRLPDGTTVTFNRGLDVRIAPAGRASDGASARQELEAVLAKWRPVLALLTDEILVRPFSLPRLLWKGWRHLPKLRGTVAAELDRMIGDPALRAALAAVTLYTGLPPERMPVVQIVGLVAMLADRFFLPEGGMGRIPAVLAEALGRHGGEVHLDARVSRILVEHGRVAGLEVEGHGRRAFDAVISSTSAMTTVTRLLDPAHVSAGHCRKVATAPLSHRALSLQLGLSGIIDAPSHFMSRVPFMDELQRMLRPSDGPPEWLAYTVPTVTMPELAPPGGSIVELYPAIDQNLSADGWTDERANAVADATIETLARLHHLTIAVRRVRSPRHFQDRMNLYAGAIYGLSPAADARAQFPHRTSVPGLCQAGQTTYPGYGIGTALMSGIFAAEAIG
ncbi:phytoene desaturase family protein [Rhodoplanes serenus]|uniref:phytoene desaturase family protein n=1 Tax=Rhodoplanes serenus TaxID=200615 RepID=UPI0012D7EDB2|nr:NAD(P)/FAD-dependent oxidoreductase [Rhodoplanes serenus]